MSTVADLFSDGGPLAAAIEGFAERAEQIAMAERIAHALRASGQTMIEAGTGVGKTFAYLVPALLSGKHIVISTGTRALQDQLFHRDLPTIARALGMPVRVSLLKGRANYVCLHRLSVAEQQATTRGLKREVALALMPVREWSRITRSGDIAELAACGEDHPVWPWVTSTRENCLGVDCTQFHQCHVAAARREAQGADIVIVNHHLLMADLMLKEEGFGDLLPGADAVIVDEAHQLPEVATHFLGASVSTRQLQTLARDLVMELALIADTDGRAGVWAQTFEREIADAHEDLRGLPDRVEFAAWPESFVDALHVLGRELRTLCTLLEPLIDGLPACAAVHRRAEDLLATLDTVLDVDAGRGVVRWLQQSQHGFAIHAVPADAAGQLGSLIHRHETTWVYTSATLAVGDNFDHFRRRLGIEQADAFRYGSPFDYESQALMYLPLHLDTPASRRYTSQVIETVWPILEANDGGAFLLFTSHRALREAADIVGRRMGSGVKFPVLIQGDAPRNVLLERFRQYGNAVLLGTGSFWEGVDVKGTALTVVVIDKLPFAVPDDPVLKARLEQIEQRGGNPFFEEQVPQAVIALKQGVGRLIRDPDDFGVVVLCDKRLTSRGYGRLFLDSLPPMRRTSRLEDAIEFLTARHSKARRGTTVVAETLGATT